MKVRHTKRALGDLKRIESYTRRHSPRGAARIGARIRDRISDLEQFALQGTSSGDLRTIVVTRTPYLVIYRVTDQVEDVAILHRSRKRRS